MYLKLTTLFAITLTLISTSAISKSIVSHNHPKAVTSGTSNTIGVNHDDVVGFSFPDKVTQDVISHDILFFYSKDALDFFDNDHEKLLKYIDGSVDINNSSLARQNIPLMRNVIAVMPLPDDSGLIENSDDNIAKLRVINHYYLSNDTLKKRFKASYVSGVIRNYTEQSRTVGLAGVGGQFSFISPYGNQDPRGTLAHELGHNDGLAHDASTFDPVSPVSLYLYLSDYSYGAPCFGENYKSIMSTTADASRRQVFFSSPLVSDPDDNECGIENVSDVARSYKEAIDTKLRLNEHPFINNTPTPEKSGEVILSLLTPNISKGEDVDFQVFFQGAPIGATVQAVVRRNSEVMGNVEPLLVTIVNSEDNSVQTFTFPTVDDNIDTDDKSFSIELVYPNKVNLGTGAEQEATVNILNGEPEPVLGIFNLSASDISVDEGKNKTLTVTRTQGADSQVTINVTATSGTAGEDDFASINQSLIFNDGETSKTFVVSATADTVTESPETLTVSISSADDVIGMAFSTIVTINDTTPVVTPPVTPPSNVNNSGGGSIGLSAIFLFAVALFRRRALSKQSGL